jgi:hypothetical protein
MAGGGNRRKVQVRKIREDGWTAGKRRIFLDHLAATSNVRSSVAAAGMGQHSAYALRRRDPDFAEQWQAAVATGYAAIEAMLMERAIRGGGGGGDDDGDGDGGPRPGDDDPQPDDPLPPDIGAMDTGLALELLRRRDNPGPGRARVGAPPLRSATSQELVEALTKRISALQRHKRGRR